MAHLCLDLSLLLKTFPTINKGSVGLQKGPLQETCTSICRFGSGLDGQSISEELTQLLALLMEPVGAEPWLVDWLWVLYKETLQPFLMLAGPASDGMAVMRFREMWGCLPWSQATFHSGAPGKALLVALCRSLFS